MHRAKPYFRTLSKPLLAACLALTVNTSLAATLTPPAFASLEQTVLAFPADTPTLLTFSLDPERWKHLSEKLQAGGPIDLKMQIGSEDGKTFTLEEAMPAELKRVLEFLHDDLKFDPVYDGLLNLGSHLSLAYRPYPGTAGHVLFSLNLRNPERARELVSRLQRALAARKGKYQLTQSNFGPQTVYTLKSPHPDQLDFRDLQFAVAGSNLIGTLGDNDALIKQMIYAQALLNKDSYHLLPGQEPFRLVSKEMDQQAAWVYFDTARLLKLTGFDASDAEQTASEETRLLQDVLAMSSYGGIGLELDDNKISSKGFASPDQAQLSANQAAYLKAIQAKPEHELTALLQYMPADPVFLTAGQHLDVLFKGPLPFNLPKELSDLGAEEIGAAFEQVFNIDYKRDFVPYLDGRYGLGLFEGGKAGGIPPMILYLGIKDGQEDTVDKLSRETFRFRPDALDKMGMPVGVKANLYQLKRVVEAYAVDADGIYPTDIQQLLADAEEHDDWEELTNPINHQTGLGLSFADYKDFKGTAEQAGMVFYEALQNASDETADGPVNYRLYAYDFDGSLYQLSNLSHQPEVIRQDLPKVALTPSLSAENPNTVYPKLVETFNGTPIYAFDFKPLLTEILKDRPDPQASLVRANMQTLHVILETYGVDFSGTYPSDLNRLIAEAKENNYWRDLTNPITSSTEQALKPYSEFKGTANQAGMVFYEPLGLQTTAEGPVATGFNLYGYAPNGELYVMRQSEEGNSFDTLRSDLPQALDQKPLSEDPLMQLSPAFARKGQLWMMAPNADILKLALGGGSPDRLKHWIENTGSQDAKTLLYWDPKASTRMFKAYLPQEALEDKELKEISENVDGWLAPWNALFGMSRNLPEGTQSQMILDLDFEKLKPRQLLTHALKLGSELAEEHKNSRLNQIKDNMHSLEIMVETYALDRGGVYAADLTHLEADAKKRDYWRNMTNPYQPDAPAMKLYQDYKPGPESAGLVLYAPEADAEGYLSRYQIYGTDSQGQLIQEKGQVLTLTNS